MAANQPSWPRQWLMTDERIGQRLWEAIDRLPPGLGGIMFRHYSLAPGDRFRLGEEVASAARERGLLLAVAGSARLAEELGASLLHNPDDIGSQPISMAVHNEAEAERARHFGAALAFIAPIHGTRSHPNSPSLGLDRAAELARRAGRPAIALGGMNQLRFDELDQAYRGLFHGFAGIDCWLGSQTKT
jgi:thiamine-phosphate pyrophosphorylase